MEQIRRDFDVESIAQRFFSASEQKQLAALPESEKVDAFFRCWTRKEAYIKAIGEGLSLPLSQFDVSLEALETNALLATRPDQCGGRTVDDSRGIRRRWLQRCSVRSRAGLAIDSLALAIVVFCRGTTLANVAILFTSNAPRSTCLTDNSCEIVPCHFFPWLLQDG